jgi:mannosyl-3-phosphoglycerate phosphatase
MKSGAFLNNGGPRSLKAPSISPWDPFVVVLTDLDGTLLDHETYDWRAARSALDRCRLNGIPVVMVSSKTRAEMDVLRRALALTAPFISENGGGVFFPLEMADPPPPEARAERGLWKWTLGSPYADLVSALRQIKTQLQWNIVGFADMSLDEISKYTGLSKASARRAVKREFDEPFLVRSPSRPDERRLRDAASRMGLSISVGGRFRHLHGKSDKGRAVDQLLAWYRRSRRNLVSVGLGDSPNDFPMLERVDIPVLVRSSRKYPDLKMRIPDIRITRLTGAAGWNAAVLEILECAQPELNRGRLAVSKGKPGGK